MAGRGRGRGRGLSINIEALGLGKGENLPGPVAVPPPLFPTLSFKPVPLSQSEEMNYMLALKQELTESFRKSPFHIKPLNRSRDIHRYSDKYQVAIADSQAVLSYDSSRLPAELEQKPKRKRAKTAARPNLKTARLTKDTDVTSLLEKLEKKDHEQGAFEDAEDDEEKKEKTGKEEEEDAEEIEEEYDEEAVEEDNDYNMAYFDNGEDYEDNDNDDEDGPTY